MSGCDFCCRRANLKDLTVMSQCGTCAAIASSERRAARSCLHSSRFRPPRYVDMRKSNWIISTQVSRDEQIPIKNMWKRHHQRKKKPAEKIPMEKLHGDFLQTSNIPKKKKTSVRKKSPHKTPSTVFIRNSPPGLQWPATRGKQGYQCWSPWLEIWSMMTHQLFQRWFFWKSVGSREIPR